MKQVLSFFLILFMLPYLQSNEWQISLNAEGALVMNAKTGKILFAKNPNEALFPASITKIATALYILKLKGDRLHEKVIAKKEAIASITPEAKRQSNYRSPAYWLETDGSHIGIKKGEEFRLIDLMYGMLLASGNDAANVLAEHVGGTIPKFMEGLNQYVKTIGCQKTHFLNPHGLHHPEQVSTPKEMAIITKEAMKYPQFREIVSTVRYVIPKTNLEFERTLTQTNLLLRKGKYFYPQAIGVKTGTTSAAGKALVAAAVEEGRELIAVVMNCQKIGERYEDVIKMFNTAFHEQKLRRYIMQAGPASLTKKIIGAKGNLKTYLASPLHYDFYPSEEVPVKAQVKWLPQKLPIEKDSCVGIVRVLDPYGNVLQQTPLLAAEKLFPSFFYRCKIIFSFDKQGRKVIFIILSAGFLLFMRKLKKRRLRS